jgi:hypothetical protein
MRCRIKKVPDTSKRRYGLRLMRWVGQGWVSNATSYRGQERKTRIHMVPIRMASNTGSRIRPHCAWVSDVINRNAR